MGELTFDRRAVLKSAGVAAVGMSGLIQAAAGRRKYVNVGVGSRSRMYLTAITETFANGNELVAICDTNQGRLEIAARFVAPNGAQAEEVPGRRLRPDAQGDEAGLRHRHLPRRASTTNTSCARWTRAATCITEKPMTTTAEKAQRILDAASATAGTCACCSTTATRRRAPRSRTC